MDLDSTSPLRVLALTAVLLLTACGGGDSGDAPIAPGDLDLAPDESVIFFRTAAWLDSETQIWHLPIHGWVHEPEDSRVRKATLAGVLDKQFGLRAEGEAEAIFTSRVNWLLADNERGRVVVVKMGGRDHEMPPTGPDGHFEDTVTMSMKEIDRVARDGLVPISATTGEAIPRTFSGAVSLVPASGVSIISDIDDTIKVSHVTERKQLLEYALFRDFEAVPGMAQRYSGWAADGAAVHYVSSSPWQFYVPLETFTERADFPRGSFHLKRVRFRDSTLLDLFKEGSETKPGQIEPILRTWPDREFVLVGDSGEQDPEVYSDLMRRYPDQIRMIYIRNVTDASREDDRFRRTFENIDAERWRLFTHPETLELPDRIQTTPSATALDTGPTAP